MHEDETTRIDTARRATYIPSWLSRISWGSVMGGVALTLAVQTVFTLGGILFAIEIAQITSITALQDTGVITGVWVATAFLLSVFMGSYVAARLSSARSSSDGLLHGVTVWSTVVATVALLSTVILSLLTGIAVITGFAASGVPDVSVTVETADIQVAANVVFRLTATLLLASLLGLLTALLGGWAGSDRISREEYLAAEEYRRERRSA